MAVLARCADTAEPLLLRCELSPVHFDAKWIAEVVGHVKKEYGILDSDVLGFASDNAATSDACGCECPPSLSLSMSVPLAEFGVGRAF